MTLFHQLAQDVDSKWAAKGFDLESFPEIATLALTHFEYNFDQTQLDEWIRNWFLKTDAFPEQINLHNQFGQPPITLFNNSKFVIDLYFWLNFDTAIHSHGFRGAFRVLHGRSLHEEFRLEKSRSTATRLPDVMLVNLAQPVIELMEKGSVRTIQAGLDLVHRVIHLENPTVSLCVKTINETNLNQWHYFPNGLAIQKQQTPARLIKELYYFQYLAGRTPQIAEDFLQKLLNRTSVSLQMNLAEEIMGGSIELTDTNAEFILTQIQDRNQGTDWFASYESLEELALAELHFEHCDSAFDRLLLHFVNTGRNQTEAVVLLEKISGHKLTPMSLRKKLKELSEDSRIFGATFEHTGQVHESQTKKLMSWL